VPTHEPRAIGGSPATSSVLVTGGVSATGGSPVHERVPVMSSVPATGGPPAVFLDRDGVLNELVPDGASGVAESPLRVEDVRLLPGAAASAARLARAGFVLVCVSNQPAAAKGLVSVEDLLAVHARAIELLAREGVELAGSRLCPHHPEGVVPELAGACTCRKPAPGMLLDTAASLGIDLRASWMVGDTDTDVGAGRAAGCRTLLIGHPGSAHKRRSGIRPDLRAADLPGATELLLGY
jgi:D-glycero-D-manno-heptose 1,7-bisphosphate phosphatase